MTKILNVDDLETSVEKVIVVKGVKYAMKPFTVEAFVNQMKELEAAAERETSGVEIYEMSLKMIARAFPGLPEADLRNMTTYQVDMIYNFLKNTAEAEVAEGNE